MRARLAELPGNYFDLIGDHAPLHRDLFNRVTLDLGGTPGAEVRS